MRLKLLIIAAILCSSMAGAQDRFFSFVEGWRNNVALEYDQEYKVLGLVGIGGPNDHAIIVNMLDQEGITVSQHQYSFSEAQSTSMRGQSQALMELNDSTVWFVGYLTQEVDSFVGAVFSYNLESEEVEVRAQYGGDQLIHMTHVIPYSDSSIVTMARYSNGATRSRIYQLHHDGSVIWSSDFFIDNVQHRTFPKGVVRLPNGQIAALFWEHDLDQPAFHDRWRTRLSLLDENGQILWDRYPGDHENYRIRPGGIMEQDGEILVAFSDPYVYDETGEWQPVANKARFERYDLSGELTHSDSLTGFPDEVSAHWVVTQIQTISDGNLLVSGYHDLQHAFLAKLTPDYETIWFERYSPYEYEQGQFPTFNTQILNTIETSDGGFLCTGMFFCEPGPLCPSGEQTAIALKVDEYGCLEDGCEVGLEELTIGALEVYPNPAKDALHVSLPAEGQERWHSVLLTDMRGKVVSDLSYTSSLTDPSTHLSTTNGLSRNQLVMDVSNLNRGLYSVLMSTEDGRGYAAKFVKE